MFHYSRSENKDSQHNFRSHRLSIFFYIHTSSFIIEKKKEKEKSTALREHGFMGIILSRYTFNYFDYLMRLEHYNIRRSIYVFYPIK